MGTFLSMFLLKVPTEPKKGNMHMPCIPEPKIVHLVLTDEDIKKQSVVVIGDVHGCLEELEKLVEKTQQKYGDCLFLFVGDIINKGPKSVETLHYVRKLNSFVSRGNHEERMIKEWIDVKSGKKTDFHPQYSWMVDLVDEDMEYIMELPYTIAVPSLLIRVVHAGISPWKHLFNQERTFMITMRNIVDIDILEPKEDPKTRTGVPWGSVWPGPEHIFYGHDAKRGLQQYPFATGLDTGCVYGGKLTAVNVSTPDREITQISARVSYKKVN